MLASIERFYPRLIPYLPKIGTAMVKQMTDAAAREFFLRVPVWTADISIDAVADQDEYTIDLSTVGANLTAHAILWMENSDEQFLSKANYAYDGETITFATGTTPAEAETAAWTVRVHVACLADCMLFPNDLLLKYEDAIVGRSMFLAAGIPGTAWHNATLAERGAQDFRRGLQKAMILTGANSISG